MEVHILDLGFCVLLRGAKTYYVKALSEKGEIYARDIEPMLEWLETHFPVVRIYFHYVRDISRSLALSRIRDRKFRETGADFDPECTEDRFSQVRTEFQGKRE